MKSLWNEQEAAGFAGDLGQRVYTSRLLGREPALVLHNGGNTSLKVREQNIFGELEDIIYIKGSGWDLADIEPAGFAPCRLAHLRRLAQLEQLSDTQMARELRLCLTDPRAPSPSVEAILHALLPAKFVDHTHADALMTIGNTPHGKNRVGEIYGNRVVVLPYIMPGFKLARECFQAWPQQAGPKTIGLVLLNHGLFSFGATARESYERMIELVTLAEQYLAAHGAWSISTPAATGPCRPLRQEIAALRREVSAAAGGPVILATHDDPEFLDFARRADVAALSQQGPASPHHVIDTKRVPLLGRDVAAYRAAYLDYFQKHAALVPEKLQMLDPAPRVILDPELGLGAIGRTPKDAALAFEIYQHTIQIIGRAAKLEGWQTLPARDIFAVEYWELEQAKLQNPSQLPPFSGEVALVTGAASGIERACVESMLARGAAVVGLDVDPAIVRQPSRPDFCGIVCDLTNEAQILAALEAAVRTFGGLDMLVLNAGIFPKSRPIAEMGLDLWRKVMAINLDANLVLMRECHPLLKLAPNGGRVVVIGSKNVPAPGPGAAAYSASKAAVNQLARVAALEWGQDRIRLNSLHPNMVFDTGIWTPEVLALRAKHYGLTVEQYKTNNVLRTEVSSHDVAELAAAMCGPLFAKTTAAQVPIDGGNDRVI